MRKIPKKLLQEMLDDPYYSKCCISGKTDEKIDLHHNLIFAGRQVNEKFCILPLAKSVHDQIYKYKKKCDWIMLNRASEEEINRYSKVVNYSEYLRRLNEEYGNRSAH